MHCIHHHANRNWWTGRPVAVEELQLRPELRVAASHTRSGGVQLSDAQWARIEPLLPARTPKQGGRWRDHREVIDAIAFKFQTGTQWVHLPGKYGNWRGVYNRRTSIGLSRWTPRSCALTSTRQERAKRGPGRRTRRPRDRPVPRRADHEDSPCCRRPLSTAGLPSHRRAGRGCAGLHGSHGPPAHSPTTGATPHQAGRGPCGQGLFVPRDPRTPAQARHPSGDPSPRGPARSPAATGQPGRQTARLRPPDLQATQHPRAVHQSPETVARYRHPLRKDRDHLYGRASRRGHLPLVRTVTRCPLSRPSDRCRVR